MSTSFKYALLLSIILCLCVAGGKTSLRISKDAREGRTNAENALANIQNDLKHAKEILRKREAEGLSDQSTRMYGEDRARLPEALRKAAELQSVTMQPRSFDRTIEFVISGSSFPAILRLLNQYEQQFPEMRMKSASWGPEQDGVFTVGLSYDLLPLPSPNSSPSKK